MAELIKKVISDVDRIYDLSGAELDPNAAGYLNFGDSSTYRSRADGSIWIYQNGAWHRFDIRAPGGTGGFLNPVDIPPLTPNAADDEFNAGSAIDTTGARRAGATAWTGLNLDGILSTSLVDDALILEYTGGNLGFILRGYTQPLASGAFRYRSRLVNITRDIPTVGSVTSGIFIRNSTTGKIMSLSMGHFVSAPIRSILVGKWTNEDTYLSDFLRAEPVNLVVDNKYFEIERDGSGTLIFRFSSEGRKFVFLTSEAQATHFGADIPNQIGIFLVAASTGSYGLHGWFRKVA